MYVLLQAHLAGFPIEEMLLAFSPVGAVLSGWLIIQWKNRLQDPRRGRRRAPQRHRETPG
jgi:hypothetical protein